MKKSIASILAILSITTYAGVNDTPNDGTSLLDDLTSTSRVVVDAFLNSSNRVHALIESISTTGTSLAPATNYTDSATNALGNALNARVDSASQAATNYVGQLRDDIESGRQIAGVANNAYQAGALKDWDEPRTMTAGEIFAKLYSAITANDVYGIVTNEMEELTSEYISTNNAAFVSAVTNCPVAIAASDAEALAEWGIYGGGGTIGALLAALAAAVAALKRGKVTTISAQSTDEQYPSAKCVWDALEPKAELVTSTPPVMDGVADIGVMGVAARADHRHPSDTSKQDRYPFIAATVANGELTLQDAKVQTWTPSAGASVTIVAAAYVTGAPARDMVLVIDCTSLTDGQEPTVTWDTHFHPRTDAATDFACAAGAKNVYYISEYAPGEFAVGGWTETAGGNA